MNDNKIIFDEFFGDLVESREKSRRKKKKKKRVYNSIKLYDNILQVFSAVLGLMTKDNRFYIAVLACSISCIIVCFLEIIDN
jgi:hypothetical protein